jgi:hypothetical protein
MIRDILNYEGVKIGELEFPDGTSEDVINKELAIYAMAPNIKIPDVSPRQLRQALVLSGLSLGLIDTAIDAQEEPLKTLAHVAWEYSTVFERSSDTVNMIGASIGLTPENIDDLWNLASTL